MGFISWIVFGLITGAIAKALHPGPDPGGCFGTILIGIIGAFLGGFLGSHLLNVEITGFNFRSLLVAIGGSILFLMLYRVLIGRRRR
ncbi:MAG: GlsB/YeaQ/YmgE family stress response membrane protein [Weeksellaceae bacterium]|nr:GlsB/YeaQ/YmgE family stress response membrane protein [Weeksellaceae bacterium]